MAKLVLQPEQFTSFTSWYLEPLWQEYFNIETYDESKTYSKNSLFVFWWMNARDPLANQLLNRGYKVIVDNLWEEPNTSFARFYQLSNANWFRWNEALWWQALGYHQYSAEKTYKKIALMPIHRVSPRRDRIVEELHPWLEHMLWSYKNNRLPNDEYTIDNLDVNQRFMNPQWYNDTCINLVVETAQHGQLFRLTDETYKSCAFYQPMLIIGQSDSLTFLRDQGFETFDNIFDESYDQESNFEKRLKLVIENLSLVTQEPYSPITWQKLQHNHNHFFNEQLCKQGIITQIIEPLIEYAES
jgi:hypothetical protein